VVALMAPLADYIALVFTFEPPTLLPPTTVPDRPAEPRVRGAAAVRTISGTASGAISGQRVRPVG